MKINKKYEEFKRVIKICCDSQYTCFWVADQIRAELEEKFKEEYAAGNIYVLTTPEIRGLNEIKKKELYKLQEEDGIFCVYVFVENDYKPTGESITITL